MKGSEQFRYVRELGEYGKTVGQGQKASAAWRVNEQFENAVFYRANVAIATEILSHECSLRNRSRDSALKWDEG